MLNGSVLGGMEPMGKKKPSPTAPWVDLGLPSGTLWAKCNVGAEEPSDLGLCCHWGQSNGIRYGDTISGATMNPAPTTSGKTYTGNVGDVLIATDDLATTVLGSEWKTPTKEQCDELMAYTTQELTTDYEGTGIRGIILTSTVNGNSIFLPSGGAGMSWSNTSTMYWSSTYYNSNKVYMLREQSSKLNVKTLGANNTLAVRPVKA